jgi:hypothetical protein
VWDTFNQCFDGVLHFEEIIGAVGEEQRPKEIARVFPVFSILGEYSRPDEWTPDFRSVAYTKSFAMLSSLLDVRGKQSIPVN